MKALETELHILLDASTSMTPIRGAALAGLNAFLEEQKSVEGRVWVSLTTFHSRIRSVWDRVPLEETAPLKDYALDGGTALYDVIGLQTIKVWTRRRLEKKSGQDGVVIFLIVTDGWDRGSRHFDLEGACRSVEHGQEMGWSFLLLGAGHHLRPMAEGLGIPPENRLPFEHSPAGMRNSLIKTSRVVTTLRTQPREPRDKRVPNSGIFKRKKRDR